MYDQNTQRTQGMKPDYHDSMPVHGERCSCVMDLLRRGIGRFLNSRLRLNNDCK